MKHNYTTSTARNESQVFENPCQEKNLTSNVVNFPFSKRKLTRFNVIPAEWNVIKTSDDKELKDSEKGVLWTIYRTAMHEQTSSLHTTYSDLKRLSGKSSISDDQFVRYLKKLSSTGIIEYKAGKIPGSNKKELIIKIDLEELDNLLYGTSAQQICPAEMRSRITPDIAYIKQIENSLIRENNIKITTEIVNKTREDFHPKVISARHEEKKSNRDFFLMSDLQKNNHCSLSAEEEKQHYKRHANRKGEGKMSSLNTFIAQKLQETSDLVLPALPPAYPENKPDKKMELMRRLRGTFSIETANLINDYYTFILDDPAKVKIKIREGFNLSDADTKILKDQIYACFGTDIKIVRVDEKKEVVNTDSLSQLISSLKAELPAFLFPELIIQASPNKEEVLIKGKTKCFDNMLKEGGHNRKIVEYCFNKHGYERSIIFQTDGFTFHKSKGKT